jgi:hypothetical protein
VVCIYLLFYFIMILFFQLLGELKNLPVYTEIYNPNSVPLMSVESDDAIIGREYYPLGDPSYRIEAGSRATVMERKEGTMIHFRTPYAYWTVLNSEIEKALDRKKHYNMSVTLQRVYEGAKVLKGNIKIVLSIFKYLINMIESR